MIDTELQERLKKFLNAQRISNSEFGRLTGTSASYVNSVKSSISFPMLRKIQEINPRLNLGWLIFGVGTMYTNDNAALETALKENAALRKEIAYLQKIVELYDGNRNGQKTAAK